MVGIHLMIGKVLDGTGKLIALITVGRYELRIMKWDKYGRDNSAPYLPDKEAIF